MADRFVYETCEVAPYVMPVKVEFEWFGGFSSQQRRRRTRSLHDAYLAEHQGVRLLEISSRSENELGVRLSAFNLVLPIEGRLVPVECAFQASKAFEYGGPYVDLMNVTPREAKRDVRLKERGELVGFSLEGVEFGLSPVDAFYRWLYIRALMANPALAEQLCAYDAFTEIEFNPSRQVNCQAVAAATYVSLVRAGRLDEAMASRESFLWTVYRSLG